MSNTTESGSQRDSADLKMRDSFLKTGKVPFGLMVKKGLASLFTDPWFTFVQNLNGPIGFVLRQRYYRRRVKFMGKGVVIDPSVDIPHPGNVTLDDFCYLSKYSELFCPEGYIKIGKRSHVVGRILGHAGVEVGNYVACNGLLLSATDSHHGGFRMSGPMVPPEQRHVVYGKIVVEDDAFIGPFSIVLPGVKIGQGAVVAPHSLVVADVAPWTVVMGSPARPMGKRDPVKFPPPDQLQ